MRKQNQVNNAPSSRESEKNVVQHNKKKYIYIQISIPMHVYEESRTNGIKEKQFETLNYIAHGVRPRSRDTIASGRLFGWRATATAAAAAAAARTRT